VPYWRSSFELNTSQGNASIHWRLRFECAAWTTGVWSVPMGPSVIAEGRYCACFQRQRSRRAVLQQVLRAALFLVRLS
jgi:hypothetical protein